MKKLLVSVILAALIALTATAVGAVVLSPGMDIIAADIEMNVSQISGEDVVFSSKNFSEAVGREKFESITITSLPDDSTGKLYFGDVPAVKGQVIKESSVSKLRFVPKEKATGTCFGFIFDDDYTMTCNVIFRDKNNTSPTALENLPLTVFVSGTAGGEMRAYDPENDTLRYEIVDYPKGGNIKFDTKTGEFTYTAGSMIMSDSFTYKVKDGMGNESETVSYTINIVENKNDTVFHDMKESGYACAAAAMADSGYMTCVEDKGKMYFSPDSEVSRLDFLVTAMNVFGADKLPKVENTGFSDDSAIPVKYKAYVYSAAKLGIISDVKADGTSSFRPNDSITRAEASVILNNIIGYEAKEVKALEGVPSWASEAVSAMYELGVYDLRNGKAEPAMSLSKEDSADMLYKVVYLIGE